MQTPHKFMLGHAAAFIAWLALFGSVGQLAGGSIKEAYELSARGLTKESEQEWRRLGADERNPAALREIHFGRAGNLLNVQPRTPANIDRAAELYRGVVKGDPDDEIGVAGAYFLIRIEQFHRGPTPDLERIAAEFLALHTGHPKRYFGQFALLKHVTLRLWAGTTTAQRQGEFSRLETYAKDFTRSELAVIYHFLMSDGYLIQLSDPVAALRHQRARDGRLMVKEDTSADLILKTAELSRETGDLAETAAHYREFLRRFPTNARAWLVRQRLNELVVINK